MGRFHCSVSNNSRIVPRSLSRTMLPPWTSIGRLSWRRKSKETRSTLGSGSPLRS